MIKLLLFLVLFSFFNNLFAQFDFQTLSGRGKGLAGISVTLDDFWSEISSVGVLTTDSRFLIGISSQNNFLLKELSTHSIASVLPIKKAKGNIGVNYTFTGTSLYKEQKVGLAYGQKFGKNLSIGMQLDWLSSNSSYAHYDKENFYTFEIGARYKINDNLDAGFFFFNPIPIKRTDKEDIPSIIKLGISYQILKQLTTIAELEKNLLDTQTLRIGLEYQFMKSMFARLGVSTHPTMYSFGYGLKYQKFDLDFAAQVHSILGISPSLSVCYAF